MSGARKVVPCIDIVFIPLTPLIFYFLFYLHPYVHLCPLCPFAIADGHGCASGGHKAAQKERVSYRRGLCKLAKRGESTSLVVIGSFPLMSSFFHGLLKAESSS